MSSKEVEKYSLQFRGSIDEIKAGKNRRKRKRIQKCCLVSRSRV